MIKDNDRHVIEFHLFDETIFNSFPQIGQVKCDYITKATYYRLFIDRMLNSDIDKVLYLDSDIVVDKSLETLWNSNISNYAVGCVTDMSEAKHDYNRLDFDPKLGYFNAGVLLINLKYWRDHHIIDEFVNIIINHPEMIEQHDQDVLNIVLCKNKFTLPLTYNVQNGFLFKPEYLELDEKKYKMDLEQAVQNPVIIHYTAVIKPWHLECNHPLRKRWFKYRNLTMWKKCRIKRKRSIIRTKIGNLLRKYHLRPQIPKEVNKYIELSNN